MIVQYLRRGTGFVYRFLWAPPPSARPPARSAADKLGIRSRKGRRVSRKKGAVCVRRKIYAAQTVSSTGLGGACSGITSRKQSDIHSIIKLLLIRRETEKGQPVHYGRCVMSYPAPKLTVEVRYFTRSRFSSNLL